MAQTDREQELLAVTLRLLQENGYERLTVEQVAVTARASKATVYRRWPTKTELVMAAVLNGINSVAVTPQTGSLRTDLLAIGYAVSEQVGRHAATMRAVLVEVSRSPALNDVLQRQFFGEIKRLINHVLRQAVERGEIDADAIDAELWDLLPGYLAFRAVIQNRPATKRTVVTLVDDVIIPSLTRRA